MSSKPELTMADRRKLWTDALRSGEYKQGIGALHRRGQWCCLGVACDVYQKHVGGLEVDFVEDSETFDGCGAETPRVVQSWLGLSTCMGEIDDGESLADNNDRGDHFDRIADLIDSSPPGLFVDPTPERPEGSAK